MNVQELVATGERLGLREAELRAWVDDALAKARDERAAEREASRQEREAARVRLEQEEKNLQLRLRLAEIGESRGSGETAGDAHSADSPVFNVNPHNFIPVFNEARDDLDAYLKRFEQVAIGQRWPKEKWATALSLCLAGEALKVFGRLSPDESVDYDKTKLALLQRFRFTAEGYRERFRQSKPQDSETAKQYATRLESFFDRWVEMGGTPKTYDGVRELIVSEQFLTNCHSALAVFLRERDCTKLSEMTQAADHFLEAQHQINLLRFKGAQDAGLSKEARNMTNPARTPRCFLCDKLGHQASDCRSRPKQPYCSDCRQVGHNVKSCPKRANSKETASCCMSPTERQCVSSKDREESPLCDHSCPERGQEMRVARAVQKNSTRPRLPVLEGELFGKKVSVLRDTGSNTLVVRRSLVTDSAMTGTKAAVLLANGQSVEVEEAIVEVLTPYFSGKATARCMHTPLYDVIVGNISGARDASDPDPAWRENGNLLWAAETSGDMRAAPSTEVVMGTKGPTTRRRSPTAALNVIQVTPQELRREQEKDPTLRICWDRVGTPVTGKRAGVHTFFVKNGLLWRQYEMSRDNVFQQVVVPKKFRSEILSLAHESPMSGHLGIKKTVGRLLEAFYWPGVQAHAQRYVRSCDACQRTFPKGRVPKAPLRCIPLIDSPFERVAVDIIGHISPKSSKGNRRRATDHESHQRTSKEASVRRYGSCPVKVPQAGKSPPQRLERRGPIHHRDGSATAQEVDKIASSTSNVEAKCAPRAQNWRNARPGRQSPATSWRTPEDGSSSQQQTLTEIHSFAPRRQGAFSKADAVAGGDTASAPGYRRRPWTWRAPKAPVDNSCLVKPGTEPSNGNAWH